MKEWRKQGRRRQEDEGKKMKAGKITAGKKKGREKTRRTMKERR